MAAQWGSQVSQPEEVGLAELCRLTAATTGRVLTRKNTEGRLGSWESVDLFLRVDLWRIPARPNSECPKNATAWRKGTQIALLRGETEVVHIEGEDEWSVSTGDDRHEFKAVSTSEAARWVAALRRRVRSWSELLQDREAVGQGLPGNSSQCSEVAGPISLVQVEATQEMVKALGVAATFTQEVLGALPIAGPVLSLLGFALEVVHRDVADVEGLRPAKATLEEVAKMTIQTLHRALKMRDEEYEGEVSNVLQMIESAARMLESHEHRSAWRRTKQAVLKLSRGPSAVLELLKQCQERLNTLKINQVEKLQISGVSNQEELQEKLVAMDKKQEVVLANQRKLFTQFSLVRRDRHSPSYIPTAPDAVALESQLCVIRNILLQGATNYVVVWGMGGIGKTTLARALANDPLIQKEFEKCSFVTISQNPNITQCQKQIWDALVSAETNVQFTTAEEGRLRLQAALKDKGMFIVLDDAWYTTHVKHFDFVSAKSRVLITSRNEEVATCVRARRYAALALGEAESTELFCKQAFVNGQPLKWQIPYVKDIVKECGGLPLALEVMGAEARGYSSGEEGGSAPKPSEKKKWRRAVQGIKSDGVVSEGVFHRVFKMSFDSLEARHRAALLDLAMLPEDHEARESDVVDMQECNGLSADEAYKVLEELAQKSLIIRTGKYELDVYEFQSIGFVTCHLHDVVRDSALSMIAELPVAERDRLVSSHLKKLAVKGQGLCATKLSTTHSIGQDRKLDLCQLEVPKLQALVLRNADMLELPASLLAMNLVVVDLTSSGIVALPTQVTCLQSAKVLRLDYCDKLLCLPSELGNMEQLTVLSMRGCRGMFDLPKSVGRLSNLTTLLMPSCGIAHFLPIEEGTFQSLTKLDISRCFGLKCLPPSLGELGSLVALDLDGCWQLTSLPATIGQLAQLEVLLLHGCESLKELPSAVTLLGNLAELDVQGCTELTCLPEGLAEGCPELGILRLQGNAAMAFPEFVVDFEQLQVLGLRKDWTLPSSASEKLLLQQVSLEQEPTEEYASTAYRERDTPLHWAAQLGLTEALTFHLRETGVDSCSRVGRTPLHWASAGGHTSTVQLLLDRGASVAAVDQEGGMPLHGASVGGHTSTVQLLLDRCASVAVVDKFGKTPLHGASEGGHTSTVHLLLDRGASVAAVDKFGKTPLHGASESGHTSIVQLLLDRGVSVDEVGQFGRTPLHWASAGGHTSTVQLLLDRGASVAAVDKSGGTALHGASEGGHTSTVHLLLDRGASVAAVGQSGGTPLHGASVGGHTSTVQLLLDRGASVAAVDKSGGTPLHGASAAGHTSTVHLLLDRGASVAAVGQSGGTPLHGASVGGHTSTVHLLLDRGASVAASDQHGCTALSGASLFGHNTTVELLLSCGAHVDSVDKDGDTPLSEAIYNGHPSTVELLLKHGANTDIQNETGATPLLLIWQKMWHQKTDEQTAAKIVQIMSDYGAALEVPNENGMTPLMAAARDGHTAAAELLLSKGVSVTPTDEDGRTAAQYASAGGHHELAEKLGGAD